MATGVPLQLARTTTEMAMCIQTHWDASLDKAHPDPYLMELLAVPPGPVADVNAAPILEEDPIVELAPVVAHDAVSHVRSLFCGP
jgi:hypothetical protein